MSTSTQPAHPSHALLSWASTQPVVLGREWFEELDSRKREEAEFHDNDREAHRDEAKTSTPNRRFYDAGKPVQSHIQSWMQRTLPNKSFLDYACGNGRSSVAAARAGAAAVIGIDISEVSVRNAKENMDVAGYSDVGRFLQRDCEATGLPDDSFDAALCNGMLHHLDLTRAFPELHRIMVPGGRILCVEALAYNPVIQWYRNRTPELRTEWEKNHILSMREVRFAKRWFRVEQVKFHLMAAPLAVLLPRPIRSAGIRVGHAIDAILTRLPLVQLWSWQFSFELVKPS
jgi:ubiquinone/menaquinone biosynthesis C-methylase UbiE